MNNYIKFLIIIFTITSTSFLSKRKNPIGKYYGYPFGYELEGLVRKKSSIPSKLTINPDGSFELIHTDVSKSYRPNKTQDFFCNGKYDIKGDTLILNSQFQNTDFITVREYKKDFCNNDVLGIEIKYADYKYKPSHNIDSIEYIAKFNVDNTIQRFQDIYIELEDLNFENDRNKYSTRDSKPTFFKNSRPFKLRFSRFHPSIRNWIYNVKDTSMNYFYCILTPDINGQSLVLENERFLIMDTLLIHLNDSFLEIDTFKIVR